MKALLFFLFALAMVAFAIITPPMAVVCYVAVFVVGSLLSGFQGRYAFSNVAGFLGAANADSNDAVGEWQMYVLHRNGKGMNSGSTLFGLMSRLANEDADAQVYNWWEKDPVLRTFLASTSYSNSATSIVFIGPAPTSATDVWSFLAPGAVLQNMNTNERIRVTVQPTDDTGVTVVRGVQGTSGTAVGSGDPFLLITMAKANGAVPVQSAYAQPTNYQNYIQTFNKTASIENAYKAGILRTDLDGPKMEAQLDALEQVANDIELAYFLGVKELVTLAAGATYYTGGIKAAIDTAGLTGNALNGNGNAGVTLSAFEAWMDSFMTWGSDTKLFFAGPAAYSAISKFANSNSGGYRSMEHSETVFGMNIETIKTPFGQFSMASHPLFKNIPQLNDWGFVIDLQLITQKVLEPLFFEEYEPVNGQDAWQGQFRAKLGLKQKFPQAFGYCYGLDLITGG